MNIYLDEEIVVRKRFLYLIDNPRDDHGNDIDIVDSFRGLIDEEFDVIEVFLNINNRYFHRETDDTIDNLNH